MAASISRGEATARLDVETPGGLVVVTNDLTVPVNVQCFRSNGQVWWDVEVPPGEVRSQDAGGPVKGIDDLPQMSLRL